MVCELEIVLYALAVVLIHCRKFMDCPCKIIEDTKDLIRNQKSKTRETDTKIVDNKQYAKN